MILRHLHLLEQTPYRAAGKLQARLVDDFLAAAASKPPLVYPPPTIITFSPPPTYTTGRRDAGTELDRQHRHLFTKDPFGPEHGTAEVFQALRGGQTTYHGPGQMVGYVITSLKQHGLGARSFVCALEAAVIATCGEFGVDARRTGNPGVWTARDGKDGDGEHEAKLCALGVHLRRFVSSHGVALNVTNDPLKWLSRIVACGLEGKQPASLTGEGLQETALTVERVGRVFAREMAQRLDGVTDVEDISLADFEKALQ